jgi:hypothetical protein
MNKKNKLRENIITNLNALKEPIGRNIKKHDSVKRSNIIKQINVQLAIAYSKTCEL